MRTDTANGLLFLLILFTGIFLRAYDWQSVPFTYDEYSALFRTQFANFSELIEKGVLPDGHPPGVQVFLYYWTGLVGTAPFLVKLPFLICGIAAVYLIYRIGQYWFNETTGLMAAAFLTSLQFPVMYSQIARPYATGLCFTLLAVLYWSRLLWEQNNIWRNWTIWVLAAILCCYNHYFSLLTIGIIGITGLINPYNHQHKKYYWLSLGVIALAFMPQLPIFLDHINRQGLEWLGSPNGLFPFRYISYAFLYSYWSLILFLLLGILGLTYQWIQKTLVKSLFRSPKRLYLLSWFLLPLVIGMAYSIWVKPVIQYKVLIFSFPFLLLWLFSFLPPLVPRFNAGITVIVLVANILTLIYQREHYTLFYDKNKFEATFHEAQKDWNRYGEQALSFTLACNDKILNRKLEKTGLPQQAFARMDTMDVETFDQHLANKEEPFLALAWPGKMKWDFFAIAHKHYPYLLKRAMFQSGSYCLFAREPHPDTINPYVNRVVADFENPEAMPAGQSKSLSTEKALMGQAAFHLKPDTKYGPDLQLTLDTSIKTKNDVILGTSYFNCKQDKTPLLTVSFQSKEGQKMKWDKHKALIPSRRKENWDQAIRTIHLANHSFQLDGKIARTGIWNNKKAECYVDHLVLKIIAGNPYYYSLTHPINHSIR